MSIPLNTTERLLALITPPQRLILLTVIEQGPLSLRQLGERLGYANPGSARLHVEHLVGLSLLHATRATKRPAGQTNGPLPLLYHAPGAPPEQAAA